MKKRKKLVEKEKERKHKWLIRQDIIQINGENTLGRNQRRNWIQTVVNGGNSGSSLTHLTFSVIDGVGGVGRPFGQWFREIQENLWDFLAALSQTRSGKKGKNFEQVMGRCRVADVRCGSRRFVNRQPLDTGKLFSTYHLIPSILYLIYNFGKLLA